MIQAFFALLWRAVTDPFADDQSRLANVPRRHEDWRREADEHQLESMQDAFTRLYKI